MRCMLGKSLSVLSWCFIDLLDVIDAQDFFSYVNECYELAKYYIEILQEITKLFSVR